MSFANPLGLFALLGIPAVLAIHLLRVRARRLQASTLFLLPASEASTQEGRRFDRLRSTPLLWVQVAAVALLAWILAEPRWLREDSTRRVVLVLDVSASMSAFESALPEALRESVDRLARAVSRTEWVVLASDPRERTLYSGSSAEEAIAAAASFRARLPRHDRAPVLATARSIASPAGLVVFVTDHAGPVPPGVELLSIGSPLANVGFAGVDVAEDGSFRAIVKSSSGSRERRRWWIEREKSSKAAFETLELASFELEFLTGKLEANEERMTLVLEGDLFTLDDRLPLVRPRPKLLRVYVAPELSTNRFVDRFVESLASVERTSAPHSADLVVARSRDVSKPSIVFLPSAEEGGSPRGAITAEKDALTDGLSFQGLLARASPPAPSVTGRALLWQGKEALVLVAGEGGASPSLVVRFPLESSNADRVPAFVLLLHRFAESVRSSVVGLEQSNVELNQLLRVAGSTPGDRAPSEPGFFDVRNEEGILFRGAARFADVRESDLTRAAPRGLGAEVDRDALRRNSLPDPLRSLWIVALAGLFLGASALQERPNGKR
jgi:hypothetical protein